MGFTKAPLINFSSTESLIMKKTLVRFLNRSHIWRSSSQLSCDDTYQMRLQETHSLSRMCLILDQGQGPFSLTRIKLNPSMDQ